MQKVGKSWATIGEEDPLNRLPQKSSRWGAETRRGGTTASAGGTAAPMGFSHPTASKRARSSGTAARGGGTATGEQQRVQMAAVLAALQAVLHSPGEGSKPQ